MFTVSPDAVCPSPRSVCSLSVTVPTPGRAICRFGSGESPTAMPFTRRFTNCEPAPLLVAATPLLALLARPATASAVISPSRMLTVCSVELLCALAAFSPTTPVVIEPSDVAATTPGTPMLAADASAMPAVGSSVATGDSASEPRDVWTNAP